MSDAPLRRIHGPQTWSLIREAYLAGASAPHLSRTLGPHVDTIRKRAQREGWTRSAHSRAASPLPPGAPEPQADPVRVALDAAGRQLAQGRSVEAAATLKAAEALRRLRGEVDPSGVGETPAGRLPPEEQVAWQERPRVTLEREADELARRLLCDTPAAGPMSLTPFVLHWRALHLGPDVAAADWAQARAQGLGDELYAPSGALRPLAELQARHRRRAFAFVAGADPGCDPCPPPDDLPPEAWTEPIPPQP